MRMRSSARTGFGARPGSIARTRRRTALRARHRSLTLQALMAKHRDAYGGMPACNRLLASAAQVRQQALQLVRQQETRYRYPLQLLLAGIAL